MKRLLRNAAAPEYYPKIIYNGITNKDMATSDKGIDKAVMVSYSIVNEYDNFVWYAINFGYAMRVGSEDNVINMLSFDGRIGDRVFSDYNLFLDNLNSLYEHQKQYAKDQEVLKSGFDKIKSQLPKVLNKYVKGEKYPSDLTESDI